MLWVVFWFFFFSFYLLLPHCRATAWQWSQMLQRPPKCSTPPHRWHPVHTRDQYGLYTPLTGCTGKNSRPISTSCLWVQSGHHELGAIIWSSKVTFSSWASQMIMWLSEPPETRCLSGAMAVKMDKLTQSITAATTVTCKMIFLLIRVKNNNWILRTTLINSGMRKSITQNSF